MIKFFALLFMFFPLNIFADANQLILGAPSNKEKYKELEKFEDDKNVSPFLSRSKKKIKKKKKKLEGGPYQPVSGSIYGRNDLKKVDNKHNYNQIYGKRPGDKILSYEMGEVLKEVEKYATHAFGFSYFLDDSDYKDPNGVFERTFDSRYGMLNFRFERIFFKSYFDLWIGSNVGFRYARGEGYFAGKTKSDTMFMLWTVPADAFLKLSVGGRWFKVGVYGGPSACALFQSRDDFEDEEPLKDRNQFGYGFAYGAHVQFSLSNIFKRNGLTIFSSYSSTNLFWNFEARGENYKHFQDEIEISGVSFGSGFTFEYF